MSELTDAEVEAILKRKIYDAHNAARRARYASDLEYRAACAEKDMRNREARNAARRARYRSDPDFRARALVRVRTARPSGRQDSQARIKLSMRHIAQYLAPGIS